MTPIFVVEKKLAKREENVHFDLIKEQLSSSLFGLNAIEFANLIIAYEPVWAIGTGVTASSEEAQEMHQFIRYTIAKNMVKVLPNKSLYCTEEVSSQKMPKLFLMP